MIYDVLLNIFRYTGSYQPHDDIREVYLCPFPRLDILVCAEGFFKGKDSMMAHFHDDPAIGTQERMGFDIRWELC